MTASKNFPLSPTMLEALSLAKEGGGKLHRLPGGFWTIEGELRHAYNGVPHRYTGSSTIEALRKRGFLAYTKMQASKGRSMFPIEITLIPPAGDQPDGLR